MKNFATPESNHLFQVVVVVETAMAKLQKKFENGEINAEKYIQTRQEIQKKIKNATKEIEMECQPFLTKKFHTHRVNNG